jgi:DNA-directed RNA polymerase specialized sigma24 family protein
MTTGRDESTAPLADFGSLYRAHAPHVRRFALYLSGDGALADDLVSEAFVRVWTARDRVELPTLRGYLFAVSGRMGRLLRMAAAWSDNAERF